jgi:hypothetical protein
MNRVFIKKRYYYVRYIIKISYYLPKAEDMDVLKFSSTLPPAKQEIVY